MFHQMYPCFVIDTKKTSPVYLHVNHWNNFDHKDQNNFNMKVESTVSLWVS